jgi:hypothetical protein
MSKMHSRLNILSYKNGSLSARTMEVKVTESNPEANADDNAEDAKGGAKAKKWKRSAKFDFSGTNYEACTMGYLAGIENECADDPDFYTKICSKAREASSARKPPSEAVDKFSSLRSDPNFLARASRCAKITSKKAWSNISSKAVQEMERDVIKKTGGFSEEGVSDMDSKDTGKVNMDMGGQSDEMDESDSGEDAGEAVNDNGNGEDTEDSDVSEKGNDGSEDLNDDRAKASNDGENGENNDGDDSGSEDEEYTLTEEGSQA